MRGPDGTGPLGGCQDQPDKKDEKADGGEKAGAAPPNFEGSWAYEGMENVVMVIEPGGKMKVTGLGDKDCVGTYEVKGDELRFTYDAGQDHCSNMVVGGKLTDDGKKLKFGASATYVKK